MSGVTVATISRSTSRAADSSVLQRRTRRGQRDVGQRLVVGGKAPLA